MARPRSTKPALDEAAAQLPPDRTVAVAGDVTDAADFGLLVEDYCAQVALEHRSEGR